MVKKEKSKILKVHPDDNIIVALQDLTADTILNHGASSICPIEDIKAKHKFALEDIPLDGEVTMYGVLIGRAKQPIKKGQVINTNNVRHDTHEYKVGDRKLDWSKPNVTSFEGRTFDGYLRSNGTVGTMNYWLVIPLVFCENRNIDVIKESMLEQLGYAADKEYSVDTSTLIQLYKDGANQEEILNASIVRNAADIQRNRIFPNVDGIKFLTHEGGCGGTRQDSDTLCRLLATYINHANVAGATILSLGCQNAQFSILQEALNNLDPARTKPVYILEQQESNSERDFIAEAVKKTFVGLIEANKISRSPAKLSNLTIGLECGGSDGFSGISANPTLGYTSDLLVTLGGTSILSEFPELNGVENELIARCTTDELANKFSNLMRTYSKRAVDAGSGFEMNPSPGNIKDGLITDAMKSAGAAKKGGTSPITDILDYTEVSTNKGLNLLCTPGNDVESTTGLASAGSNIILFTTGLGTPTGNPIAPVIKVSSNNALSERMNDIIDFNTGSIITGDATIEDKGKELLEYIIAVASGRSTPAAVRLGQDDFIPWKRGISL